MKPAVIIICAAALLVAGVTMALSLDSTGGRGMEVYAMQKCAL